mmetsp:Transcript_4220/g.9269  ORF Transcript_4220/g.9269 Transcript_4220/m.9269 type:complete len:231 (+) Transcript_4220:500-1192(+)
MRPSNGQRPTAWPEEATTPEQAGGTHPRWQHWQQQAARQEATCLQACETLTAPATRRWQNATTLAPCECPTYLRMSRTQTCASSSVALAPSSAYILRRTVRRTSHAALRSLISLRATMRSGRSISSMATGTTTSYSPSAGRTLAATSLQQVLRPPVPGSVLRRAVSATMSRTDLTATSSTQGWTVSADGCEEVVCLRMSERCGACDNRMHISRSCIRLGSRAPRCHRGPT